MPYLNLASAIGRLDRPSEFPPKIQFPARLKADFRLPVVEAALGAREGGRYGSIARSVVLNGTDRLLRLREDLADGDAQLSAGLQDPHARASERKVFPVGSLDEAVQDGIVEGLPPVAIPGRLSAHPQIPGFQPVRRHHGLRPLEVWPDHASRTGQERRDEQANLESTTPSAMSQVHVIRSLLLSHRAAHAAPETLSGLLATPSACSDHDYRVPSAHTRTRPGRSGDPGGPHST